MSRRTPRRSIRILRQREVTEDRFEQNHDLASNRERVVPPACAAGT